MRFEVLTAMLLTILVFWNVTVLPGSWILTFQRNEVPSKV